MRKKASLIFNYITLVFDILGIITGIIFVISGLITMADSNPAGPIYIGSGFGAIFVFAVSLIFCRTAILSLKNDELKAWIGVCDLIFVTIPGGFLYFFVNSDEEEEVFTSFKPTQNIVSSDPGRVVVAKEDITLVNGRIIPKGAICKFLREFPIHKQYLVEYTQTEPPHNKIVEMVDIDKFE